VDVKKHLVGTETIDLFPINPLEADKSQEGALMGGISRKGLIFSWLMVVSIFWVAAAQSQTNPDTTYRLNERQKAGLQKIVSIDADDTFLPSILSILAEKSGFNIVTGPGVNKEERVSVHLKDTPIEHAMNLVVRAAGLSYDVVGNSFLVAKSDKLKEQVGVTSYVVPLQYADAAETKELLKDFNAQVQVDQGGNNLLVITSPKVISEIQSIVSEIDRPSLQIMLEARLVEVAVEDEEQLGIDWSKLAQLKTILVEDITDANGTRSFGVPETDFRQGELPDNLNIQRIDGLHGIGSFSRQVNAFDVTLDWLLKNNKAEVLANSEVATMNNREARLEVIDVIPYILSAGGVGGQVQVYREEVGIKLNILPKVNTDGYITTQVTPEVSSVFQLIGPDNNIPWVIRRTSTTTIRVKDGQSILIAGLLGVNRSVTLYKVPFLGDIPFIGGLFRHRSESTKKTDLIIQVTPHILMEAGYTLKKPDLIKETEDRFLPKPEEKK
jgi:type II secretory pathway component GspD/PulD (secretin)